MNRIGCMTVLVALLAGCHSDTKIDYLDRVHTTAEYLKDGTLRTKVIATCDANDNELLNDPNCVNARMAKWQMRRTSVKKKCKKRQIGLTARIR
jgi:hypothetical protein